MSLFATVGTAFGIQALCAAFAIPVQSEKYYDLSGSATFLTCTAVSLYYPSLRYKLLHNFAAPLPRISSFHHRQLIMSGFTCLWATRLGSFLYQRIKKSGSDARFDEIKRDPARFFGAWMAQASWVTLTAFPVYAVNSVPASRQPALGLTGSLGTGLWLASFLFEVVADRQKTQWREEKMKKIHSEEFISSGLWSVSRHPNYVGEVMIWASQVLIAWPALPSEYKNLEFITERHVFHRYSISSDVVWIFLSFLGTIVWMRLMSCLSPVLEYLLITKVSGLPPLETKADKQFKIIRITRPIRLARPSFGLSSGDGLPPGSLYLHLPFPLDFHNLRQSNFIPSKMIYVEYTRPSRPVSSMNFIPPLWCSIYIRLDTSSKTYSYKKAKG
ncbi:hypothetical protein H4Q26_001780 [Puccinia striiformis f. sp. tritici PST-130]|nr:hypothetical protein H4Q26_001780 [Puccinia striiformis f. sp. tritici PST-130]